VAIYLGPLLGVADEAMDCFSSAHPLIVIQTLIRRCQQLVRLNDWEMVCASTMQGADLAGRPAARLGTTGNECK